MALDRQKNVYAHTSAFSRPDYPLVEYVWIPRNSPFYLCQMNSISWTYNYYSAIGAGDTFIAGMLYSLLCRDEWPLEHKLAFSNELAGRKVAQEGFSGLGAAVEHYL